MLRMFPELTAGLHLDRYARVLRIAETPDQGGTCERFRPRYAVDLEILTPEGSRDDAYPEYTAVPLPLPMGAGHEAGVFGYPEPGTLVIIGFAYGRPDHPVIRQFYPLGLSLPELRNGEHRWQQAADVFQCVDPDGNWTRTTAGTITDESIRHIHSCVERMDSIARELRQIAEHSTEKIGGVKRITALGAMRLLSGGSANLSAADNLNLTTGRDCTLNAALDRHESAGQDHVSNVSRHRQATIGGNCTEQVGGGYSQTVGENSSVSISGKMDQTVGGNSTETVDGNKIISASSMSVEFSGTMRFGSGSISLLHLMLDVWKEVRDALRVLADHTHNSGIVPMPDQSGAVHVHADAVDERRCDLEEISG